jgi:replicative DNA helicase
MGLGLQGIVYEKDTGGAHRGDAIAPEMSPAVSGAAFVLDGPDLDTAPRWGTPGGEIAWQKEESLLLVGPTGVGKTTVAVQIVGGLIGLWPESLGMPFEPVERVLYLALDRASQIRRAMARVFTEEHRKVLESRLVVWPRPLPKDLGRHPDLLADLAIEYGARAVVIDSLKDTTAKISDDEMGSNLNRAVQLALAEGVDVLGLHHQRKGQQGSKPKTLEDVYGSTWITAGAGSVLLLWGEAGSELVDLEHLKQPAEPVGPLRLEHDHHAGMTTVVRGFDPVAYLRRRPGGATLAEVAQAQWGTTPNDAQKKKTERRLRNLAGRTPPLVVATGKERGEDGGFSSGRYYAAETGSTTDTTTDTA